jgi:LmbE family N-acetylglucosaminyl deacetylase
VLNGVFENTLVISPHCDDEVIGCGGLMKKVIRSGGNVTVLVMATGDTKFYHLDRVVTAQERENELREALGYLGVTDYSIMYRDKESLLDTVPMKDIVSNIDMVLKNLNPTAVLLPYPSFHQDHKVTFDASFAALRPSPAYTPRMVAMYEYPFVSWSYKKLEGGAIYVDIKNEIDDKVEALKLHKSQVREAGHAISPETIRMWAQRRGFEVSLDYAELFRVLRMTV